MDKSEYVLGVEPDGERSEDDLAARARLFQEAVQNAHDTTGVEALAAVGAFLTNDYERRRAVQRISTDGYKSNDLFAFAFRGHLVHDIPEVREYFSQTRHAGPKGGVQCLVCGSVAMPAKKHPSVRVPTGSPSGGIALVSFNSDAFESYGLVRNQNAPVCRDCADAYTTALNRLLSDRYPDPKHPGETLPRRSVSLSSDTTAVFWADQEAGVLDQFTNYFDAPRVESVGALFESAKKGRAPANVSNRFYCLILSGAQGRAIVRSTHTGTVSQVEENLRRYFEAIDVGTEQPLPLIQLMRGLVLQGKLDNLAPEMATEVFIAIVFGNLFPRTLLASAVGRCRAERKVTRERAAFLRAYLNRNEALEVSVGLDKDNMSVGYRLGRLLAVLERAQNASQRGVNKTIVDRYYSSASTRPATVFPTLVAGGQHHIAKLKAGLQMYFQKELGEVIDGIAVFPPVLRMEEQGLFALGYYHQRQDFFKKTEVNEGNEEGEAA